MSTNQVQRGNIIDFTAPSGGVVSGAPVLIGGVLAVPMTTVAQTLAFAGAVCGVFEIAKEATTAAFTEGEAVYWDDTAKRMDESASGRYEVGFAVASAINTDTTVKVKLNGFSVAAVP